MKTLRTLIFTLLLIAAYSTSNATHIVGGNINYRYLGNDKYELTLTMFRDCVNGQIGFDTPASFGVFDVNNLLLQDRRVFPQSIVKIPPSLEDSCYKPPVNVCYERAIYVDTVTLPLITGGYQIVYQRCCRNGTINNIVFPLKTGATYLATIPTDVLISNLNNSNPVFKAWPQLFLCADKPLVFDHSAIDYDGDSLAYQLYTPFTGTNQTIPQPQPPNNPPYTNIMWVAGYSTNDMMGGVPMQIHPTTGLLTATPHIQGQFVVGIKCMEYRNGVLISETLRDFQFNVVVCQKYTTASTFVPVLLCTNQTPIAINFTNNSTGANGYKWDFGITTQLNDTSLQTTPNFTYNDTGYYDIRLIAYGIKKGCNDTVTKRLHLAIKPQAMSTYTRVACSDSVTFKAQAINGVYPVKYQWYYNDGTAIGNDSNNVHYYNNPTTYAPKVIVTNANGCKDTITHNVVIPQQPRLNATSAEYCKNESAIISVKNCTNPVWTPNVAISNVTSLSPIVHPLQTTTYYVSGYTTSSAGELCLQKDSSIVTVNNLPKAAITTDKDNCSSYVIIGNASTTPNTAITNTTVNWGDGTAINLNYNHTYTQVGYFTITLIVTDNKGCKDTAYEKARNFNMPRGKKQVLINCDGKPVQLQAQASQYYNWNPVNDLNSINIQNPITTTDSTKTYYCTLTNFVTANDTCITLDTLLVKVSQTQALAQLTLNVANDTIVLTESTNLLFTGNSSALLGVLINDNTVHSLPSIYEIKPTKNTTYYASVKDSLGCVFNYGDSLRIVVLSNLCAEPYVLIPTGFTPNNDGVNDEFKLSGLTLNPLNECYIVVYNRWGQKVFETNNVTKGWDGTFNGLLQDAGAYAYVVKITCRGGMSLEEKGNVTLIR
jgi:gliding motility-associated-like protein